jgi:hypothetical protein
LARQLIFPFSGEFGWRLVSIRLIGKPAAKETVIRVRISLAPPGPFENSFSGRSRRRLEAPILASCALNLWTPTSSRQAKNVLSQAVFSEALYLCAKIGFADLDKIAVCVTLNSANFAVTREMAAAVSTVGVQIEVIRASDIAGIDAAFAVLVRNKTDALVVGADPFFFTRRVQFATLATRHAIPAIYTVREYPEAGCLMSYGTSLTEVFRQLGIYTGRILKGAKPTDLPVVQSTKFDFVINLTTARTLGIEVPPTLLARADEVIE